MFWIHLSRNFNSSDTKAGAIIFTVNKFDLLSPLLKGHVLADLHLNNIDFPSFFVSLINNHARA